MAERAQGKERMLEQLASSYRDWMGEGFDDSLGGAQAREDAERALRERSRIRRLTHVCENLRKQWLPHVYAYSLLSLSLPLND